MAGGIEVQVSGINEVKSSLNKLGQDLESNIELNKELSTVIAQRASAIAPKLTGALASSIVGNASGERAQIVAGGPAVPYAGVIEYGWPEKGIQAQPYLTTAVNKNMDFVIQEYEKTIQTAIKKYNLD